MTMAMRHAALGTTKQVKAHLEHLMEAGCQTTISFVSGDAYANHGDQKPFVAIQKGRKASWLCMFYDTDKIKWKGPFEDDSHPTIQQNARMAIC